MDKGVTVTDARPSRGGAALGQGHPPAWVEVALDVRELVLRLQAEHIHVPIVACGTQTDARATVAATMPRQGIHPAAPPTRTRFAAVLAAVAHDARKMVYRDDTMARSRRDPQFGEAVREATFRPDLFLRLHVMNLESPPLRERTADVLELAQDFAKFYAQANGVRPRSASS